MEHIRIVPEYKLYFIAATYNEEEEIDDLLNHVMPLNVDGLRVVDDGSIDSTFEKLRKWSGYWLDNPHWFIALQIPHTGLPETVKNEALQLVPDNSWVLMLDADERLTEQTIKFIEDFFRGEQQEWDYVYFKQLEIIDGLVVREFQKCKLFRKEVIKFPLDNIHADDQFTGRGTYKDDWRVLHRKTTNKQINREQEYIQTYKKLLGEGKIDEGRYKWLVGLHHYIKE